MAGGVSTTNRVGYRAATVYAGAAPGADTDILTADLEPGANVSAYRITVSLATGSVFNVAVTDGTDAYTLSLNGGTALTASCFYTFVLGVSHDDDGTGDGTALAYNFQVATDSVIQQLLVDEVVGPVI